MGLGKFSKLNFLVLDGFESGLQTQEQAERNINFRHKSSMNFHLTNVHNYSKRQYHWSIKKQKLLETMSTLTMCKIVRTAKRQIIECKCRQLDK